MSPRTLCVWAGSIVLWLIAGGCRPLHAPEDALTARKLPPLTAASDAINLDIVFVERPIGDRLLGDDLWSTVDQTAALDQATRSLLAKSGFRLGVTGASPPSALQTLLGLTADFADEPVAEQSKKLIGRQAILRDGWSTEIQLGPGAASGQLGTPQTSWDTCPVPVYRVGEDTPVERVLESVRCVCKVTARRLEDGWAELDFLPQVHHGVPGPIISPGKSQFELTYSQRVEEYPHLRFSVRLNIGEMAILTAADLPDRSLARLFFVGPEEDSKTQRVLIIRLANMGLKDDPYGE